MVLKSVALPVWKCKLTVRREFFRVGRFWVFRQTATCFMYEYVYHVGYIYQIYMFLESCSWDGVIPTLCMGNIFEKE